MQGTWVWSLVRKDSTCHGASKPVHHSYWAHNLEPMSFNYRVHAHFRALKPWILSPSAALLEPTHPRAHALQREACEGRAAPAATARESLHATTKTQHDNKEWKFAICNNMDGLRGYYAAAAAAESLQSCPTLCDPIDRSPPGSPVPGTLQARTLEWVAIAFSHIMPSEMLSEISQRKTNTVWYRLYVESNLVNKT